MKANDLRIGNYLTSKTWKGVHSVSGIQLTDNGFKVLVNGYYHTFGEGLYCELEAIPLSPEILEKAGARWLGYAYFIGKLKFTYEHNELSQFVRFHYSGKVVYLQYVHELQNLVFAITQKEIPITF